MESPALQLLCSSSSSCSSSFRSCSWVPAHSPVVLHFASRSLFSRAPSSVRTPCRSSSRISASLGDEEQRWLREEERWLREEQRWLREESRWHAERQQMADELALLKREVEHLRTQVHDRRAFSTGAATLPSVIASLKQLVKSLPAETRPNIEFVEEEDDFASALSVSDAAETLTFSSMEESPSTSFSPSPSIPSMSEFSIDLAPAEAAVPMQPRKARRRELRKGAEGDEVKELQEALEELGFYSGEEDIEYSMFADGTETAVKTWQASLSVREDGIASSELLATLFGESPPSASTNGSTSTAQSDPWRAPPPAAKGSEIGRKKTFAEDKRDVEDTQDGEKAANRRVFLLGENRWEEPGRLPTRIKGGNGAMKAPARPTDEKCFSCKGEGVCMCTECEGTGELNVEDQFLEWVEEGAKCPYCEGSGAIPCDVCLGRGVGAPV